MAFEPLAVDSFKIVMPSSSCCDFVLNHVVLGALSCKRRPPVGPVNSLVNRRSVSMMHLAIAKQKGETGISTVS